MTEAVVFLPDMMCDARLFGPQIAEMSATFAVTVAPVTQGERVEEIASQLLGCLPQRFSLVGSGFGGVVAMEISRRAPDRLMRLALVSTTPLAETPQVAASWERQIVRVRAGQLPDVLIEEIPLDCVVPGPFQSEVHALIMDMATFIGAEAYVRQVRAMQRRRDQQLTLQNCQVPTLVLCGEQDTLYPVQRHSVMAEFIPKAEFVVLPDAGHFPSLETPAETSEQLIAWMKRPPASR